MRRLLAAVLCAALGCGGAAPAESTLIAGRTKTYAPQTLAADARDPALGVLLATDASDGSTVIALAAAPQPVVVDTASPTELRAVTVQAGPVVPTNPANANAASATAASATAASAVTPDLATATAGWGGAAWTALLVAADTLGKEPIDLAVAIAPHDGDAASAAALAVGVLASRTGASIDRASIAIGGLALDGAVLPVAGVPERVAAALARGKTRIGVPAGMRRARDAAGQIVDLGAAAEARGAKLVELATVHDAYQLLTRQRLPAPVPLDASVLSLDAADAQAAEALYVAWQRRVADAWPQLLLLEQGRLSPPVARAVRAAKARVQHVEAMHRAGATWAAVEWLTDAWAAATAATVATKLLTRLQAGDVDAALALLDAAEAQRGILDLAPASEAASIDDLLAQLTAHRAGDRAAALDLLAALRIALRGWIDEPFARAAHRDAHQLLAAQQARGRIELGTPAAVDAVADAVMIALTASRGQLATTQTVADLAAQLSPSSSSALPVSERVTALGAPLASAAQALFALASGAKPSIEIERAAALAGATRDAVLAPCWTSCEALGKSPAAPRASDPDPATAELRVLAARSAALSIAATSSLRHVAALLAAHPDALHALLAQADRAALATARAARIATGRVPRQAQLAYQRGTGARAAGDALAAIAWLWESSAASRAAIAFARNPN